MRINLENINFLNLLIITKCGIFFIIIGECQTLSCWGIFHQSCVDFIFLDSVLNTLMLKSYIYVHSFLSPFLKSRKIVFWDIMQMKISSGELSKTPVTLLFYSFSCLM